MPEKKVHEIYGSLKEWALQHEKTSSLHIVCALEDGFADPEETEIGSLKAHISRLLDMRSEINSEISEAREWVQYLRRQGR